MLASTMKESGLVYIGDILFDNSNERMIRLDGDETAVSLTSYAQDHETSLNYTITIVKSAEEPEPTLDEIRLTGPTKTEYVQGEELDLSGLVVTAVYSDGSEGVPRSAGVSEGLNENDLGRSPGSGHEPPPRSISNSPLSQSSSPSGAGLKISPKDGILILIRTPPSPRPPS